MTQTPVGATWLGHGTFLFHSAAGRRILIDPFLENNPACPASFKKIDALDLLLITHGHSDHIEEAARLATSTGATVVGIWEVCQWLLRRGVEKVSPMNKGGSQELLGIRVSMVHALHSSSYTEEHGITYLGEAAGYVLRFENGVVVYFAGDTSVFSDMALIRELYAPSTAFLPIGDLFTMGPDGAAKACELLGVRRVVPMHFATFPALTGTPQALRRLVEPMGVRVLELKPGETGEIGPIGA